MKQRRLQWNWGLLFILTLAASLRLLGLGFGLPDLLHPDEYALINHALGFGHGDFNPHWFMYPSLQMYLLFLLYGVVFVVGKLVGAWGSTFAFGVAYFRDPTFLQTISRLATLAMGVATVGIVFSIVRRWWKGAAAVAAALVLAGSSLHCESSRYVTTDVPMVFWVVLATAFCQRFSDSGRTAYLWMAAFSAGLAGATKYPGLAAVFGVFCCPLLVGSQPLGIRLRLAAASMLFGLAGFGCGAPFTFLDFTHFRLDLQEQAHVLNTVGLVGGNKAENGWLVQLRDSFPAIAGSLILTISAVGSIVCLLTSPRRCIWLLSFPMVVFLVIGMQGTIIPRYSLPIAPFVSIFAGVGFGWICSIYKSAAWRVAFIVLFTAGLWPMYRTSFVQGLEGTQVNTRTEARRWIESHLPANAKIVITQYSAPLTINEAALSRNQDRVSERLSTLNRDKGERGKSTEKFRLQEEAMRGKPRFDVYDVQRYWQPDTFGWLLKQGVAYAAIDGNMEFRYRLDGKRYPDPVRFFDHVKSEGKLLECIQPRRIRFSGFLSPLSRLQAVQPGPIISIYRLPISEAAHITREKDGAAERLKL